MNLTVPIGRRGKILEQRKPTVDCTILAHGLESVSMRPRYVPAVEWTQLMLSE